MPASTRRRASPLLFKWEPLEFGLDADGLLWALSGNRVVTATYDRGGTVGAATSVDVNGRVFAPGYKSPRFFHQYDATSGLWTPRGPLLEGAWTNLVVQSDDLRAASGWSVDAGFTVVAAYATLGSLNLSRIAGDFTANQILRSVTLTGDGVKGVSQVVEFDVAGIQNCCGLYDSVAAAYRALATVTWAADGTATAVAAVGTLLSFERLGSNAYRILMSSTSCTAANGHLIVPCSTGSGTPNTVTAARVGAVQVENAAFPSSIIPTLGSTVTRSADALWFVCNISAAQCAANGVTLYDRMVVGRYNELSSGIMLGAATGSIGDPNCVAMHLNTSNTLQGSMIDAATPKVSTLTVSLAIDDELERLVTVTPAGVVTISASVNGAAATTATPSAAGAWPTAFGTAKVFIGDQATAARAGNVVQRSVRIAASVRDLSYMRAA